MNTWMDSLGTLSAIIAVLSLFELEERLRLARSEIHLGALTCRVNAWRRMRRAYMRTLHHSHRERVSWRKKVQVMSEKIRGAMAVSARGSGETDDAIAAYHRPHSQNPDMAEVERFMGYEDPIEYLRSSAGRCQPLTELDDDEPLLMRAPVDRKASAPPKSGVRAKQQPVLSRRRLIG